MSTVYRQQYHTLPVPAVTAYTPTLPVTVIIPARDRGDGTGQAKLDLVLASLAAQDLPDALLHVIVADDGSPEPLKLPNLTPANTTIVRLDDNGPLWGKSRAFNTALERVTTPLVMSLDADMLLHPSHLRTLMRWAETSPAAVALGWKRMVAQYVEDPAAVHAALQAGEWDSLVIGPGEPHAYFEDLVASTNDLKDADLGVFRALVGAAVLLRTDLLRSVGGYDVDMRMAEDTELGYRLVQAGAVLVPERNAHAWHLGITTMTEHRDVILPHNQALLTSRVPLLDYLRRGLPARMYSVPTVHVRLTVEDAHADHARATVDAILAGKLGVDAVVTLIADWPDASRYQALTDTSPGLRRLANLYVGEPRVRVAAAAPDDAWPAPYVVHATGGTPFPAVKKLIEHLRSRNVGVAAVAVGGLEPGTVAAFSTAAVRRAHLTFGTPSGRQDLIRDVTAVWGAWWCDGDALGIRVSVSSYEADPLLSQQPGTPSRAYAQAAWRSWASAGYRPAAAVVIGRGVARGAARRIRREAKKRLSGAASKL